MVVVGPTASGKSDFAVQLALKHNGEIISADSRQIYKGLDIGTGKITQEEMQGIPHYMIDVCNPEDDFSVATYKCLAMPILEDILSRGKTPIICGGTGQYIDALIFTQETPHVGPDKKLRDELEKKTTDELYQQLLSQDPRRAQAIDKHNKVRLIRALEIVATLGEVPALDTQELRYDTDIYLMDISRELLRDRITRRLYKRLDIGMKEEVEAIVKKGYDERLLKKCGLEYVAISKHIKGITDEEEMKKEIITASMQYAKRQQTWNKKYIPLATLVPITS
jgi:tRNA dimethylallyltransferase